MSEVMVEISARHVHVTEEVLHVLFGEGYELGVKKMLSQPGQFASNERVEVVGPKRSLPGVIFLRKLVPGGSEHSFGIHVARLAGMPPQVLNRADSMLKQLEEKSEKVAGEMEQKEGKKSKKGLLEVPSAGYQLSFIQLDDPTLLEVRDAILDIDIDTLTPLEALLKLNEIKKIVAKK